MYVPEPVASALDAVRRILDPVQSNLIPAHVTLCREDELALVAPAQLANRLADVQATSIKLSFGPPVAFHEHGVLLPCISGEETFCLLREYILGSSTIRYQAPHITLAHPRNPRALGNSLSNAGVLPVPLCVTFSTVMLIEQVGGSAWRVLQSQVLRTVMSNQVVNATCVPHTP